jgi:CDP-glycerol glycerophosphotransferase (TagB/SpsB family)
MNAVKAWFFGRLFREKLLVLGLVLIGAIIWLSSASDNLRASLRGFRSAESDLATQAVWLENRPAIDEAAKAAVRNLDPAKTFNALFLVGEITRIAKASGLDVNTESPRTQRSPQFSVHTVQVTTRRAEMVALLRFYQELASKAPYLGLEQVSLQGDRTNPGLVNATLQVASVELVREAAPAAK